MGSGLRDLKLKGVLLWHQHAISVAKGPASEIKFPTHRSRHVVAGIQIFSALRLWLAEALSARMSAHLA